MIPVVLVSSFFKDNNLTRLAFKKNESLATIKRDASNTTVSSMSYTLKNESLATSKRDASNTTV